MGILGWLFGGGGDSGSRSDSTPRFASELVTVDLTAFTCNSTPLGEPTDPSDPFHGTFNREGIYRDVPGGLEIGVEEGKLDFVFLTLDRFRGKLLADGKELPVSSGSTEADITALFGEPYWRDEDDQEVLLFYEDGRVELQFEFPGKERLGFITLLLSPLLGEAEQRASSVSFFL